MSDERNNEGKDDLFDQLGRELGALDVDERRAERIRWLAQGELVRHREHL